MFLTANSRHIVSVCKRFTEADKVSLEAVIVVRTCKVKTEACTNIINDENHTMVVAELTNFRPLLFSSANIIKEIAVVVRLSNKTRNIAAASIISFLHSVHIKPRNYNVVFNFFRENTGIVNLLRPLEVTVIISFKEHHLLFTCVSTSAHNAECCSVGTVFHKECPVCCGNSVFKKLGALNHFVRWGSGAVAPFKLLHSSLVNIIIAVT